MAWFYRLLSKVTTSTNYKSIFFSQKVKLQELTKIYILLKLQVLDLYKDSSNSKYFSFRHSANSGSNSFAYVNFTILIQINV